MSPKLGEAATQRRVMHLISTPTGFGGAEHVLRQVAEAQMGAGDDVLVVNPFCRSAADVAEAAAFYTPARFAGRVTTNIAGLVTTRRWLQGLARSTRPHVVHGHLFHAIALMATVRWPGAIRLATHHHGALLRWQGRRIEASVDRWATRRTDCLVAVSSAVMDHIVGHCNVSADRVRVVHNGWTGAPRPHVGSATGTTLACVANLRPEKGHQILFEALRRVRSEEPSATLVLVGDGPLRGELETLARQLGIADAITLRGRVDNIWADLASADVFVLAAFQEPLGIAVLEAMAAGLPVVATAVGGIPEILPPTAGILVHPADPDAFAEAVIEVLRDASQRGSMAAAGQRAAAERTSGAMVRAYVELYDEIDPPARRHS